jgi:hypothetical protein
MARASNTEPTNWEIFKFLPGRFAGTHDLSAEARNRAIAFRSMHMLPRQVTSQSSRDPILGRPIARVAGNHGQAVFQLAPNQFGKELSLGAEVIVKRAAGPTSRLHPLKASLGLEFIVPALSHARIT